MGLKAGEGVWVPSVTPVLPPYPPRPCEEAAPCRGAVVVERCCWRGEALGWIISKPFAFSRQDGISVKALSEPGDSISNKKPRKAGSTGSLLYGRFVKVTGPRAWGLHGPQSPVFFVPLGHSPCVCAAVSHAHSPWGGVCDIARQL